MPMPEGSQLNRGFSPIMTTMAVSYLGELLPGGRPGGMGGFIGTLILPQIYTGSAVGTYVKWLRGDFRRLEAKKLANAEPAPVGGFVTGTGTFNTENYGIAANWTARDLADARRGGISDDQLIAGKNRYVVEQSVLRREVNAATLIQTAGNWTRTWAGVASAPVAANRTFLRWSDAAATPVDDIIAMVEDFRSTTGFMPNTLQLSRTIWNALRKNASLIDRIKYGGTMDRPTQITMNQLKALFEIDNILIGDEQYNSAKEGAADVFVDIWDQNKMWLGYVDPNPMANRPSAGFHFTWVGDVGEGIPGGRTGEGPQSFGMTPQGADGIYIRRYNTVRPAAEYVEAELWTKPNVVAADMGMTITAVLS